MSNCFGQIISNFRIQADLIEKSGELGGEDACDLDDDPKIWLAVTIRASSAHPFHQSCIHQLHFPSWRCEVNYHLLLM